MKLPVIHPVDHISFPTPESMVLENGIPVYGFNGTKNDILRIDVLFDSGRWTEPSKLIAESAGKLFKSGTEKLSAFELNEKIDFYGSTIRATSGYNTFTVSLYCMNRYLEPSLQLLKTCLTEIIFPEPEIALLKQNATSKLKVSREKTDYLADEAFRSAIYGDDHPYGYETTEENIEGVNRTLLQQFYHTDIQPQYCTIFIAGSYTNHKIKLIDTYLGKWKNENPVRPQKEFFINTTQEKQIRVPKEKSVQASIVIGKTFFNKHHEDYAAFILLNTVFGGYFGSRLMSNIREDKGLTYGIYSGLSTLKHNGFFSIHTDTNVDTLPLCLGEIYKEMARLQKEPIPQDELNLARNYLLGKFLSKTDGPFNRMEIFKSYFIENIDIHKFEEFAETIKGADAVSLQRLAQKYFLKESMIEVIAG